MRKFRYIAMLGLLALAISAMFGANHSAAQAGGLFIRVAQVTPGIAAQDVYVDGSKVLTALAYKQVSAYQSVAAGHHVIKVADTGTTQGASLDADFATGQHLTFYAYPEIGSVSGGTPHYKPGLAQVEDSYAPLAAGKARVSVSHFSPDASNLVSVVVSGTSGSALVFQKSATFGRTTATSDVDAGVYSVQVSDAQGNTLTTANNVNIAAGKVYNLAIIGLAKGTPALEELSVAASVNAAAPTTPTVAAAAPTATAAITPTVTVAVKPTATLVPTVAALPPAPTPTAAKTTPTAVKVIAKPTTTPMIKPTATVTMPAMPRTGGGGFDPLWLLLIAVVILAIGLGSRRLARTGKRPA